MRTAVITEQEMIDQGYFYLGEYGGSQGDHVPNQLWRKNDELCIYDPEEKRILSSLFNEPRYQNYTGL